MLRASKVRLPEWLTSARSRDIAILALALAPALWECSKLIRETPLSYDHSAHLFKAWHFWDEMLSQGRLRGWSHYFAFGFPAGEQVPPGSDVWVALFRALTFGQLSWLRTYALAFAALLILKSLSTFLFARRFVGPAAAVVCAWIAALDPGGMLEGGWTWHTSWGVWPVTLAMSFVLLSLERFEVLLSGGRRSDALLAGLWFAAALLTHQMAMVALVIVLPILALDHWFRSTLQADRMVHALCAVGLGFALSAFFLLPFIARTSYTQDLGWLGDGLALKSQQFTQLRTFQFTWLPIQGLCVVGAWLMLRRRVPGALFLVITWLTLVLLSSGMLLRDLHLERVLPGLIKLEANRFLLVAKLFCFPVAGYAVVELFRACVAEFRAGITRKGAIAVALVAGLAIALLAPGWDHFYKTQIHKDILGEKERKYWKDLSALLQWTAKERKASKEHYRIAYELWRGEHLPTLAPVFDNTPIFKVGYTPSLIFDAFPMTGEPEVLEAASVKYVVSAAALKRDTVELVQRFGGLWLYRFKNYRPDPFKLVGAGQGQLLEFSPERIRIRVSGTATDSRLKLHVARFPRWRARYVGAKVVSITAVPVYGVEYPWLMEVPARDGELVFEYVYRGVDRWGLWITLLALPAFAGVLWLERRHRLSERGVALITKAKRPLAVAGLIAALVVVALVVRGARSRARLLPPSSLFQQVKAEGDLTFNGKPCKATAPLSFLCGKQRVRAEVVPGTWGLHLCMTAPGSTKGELGVRVRRKLGSFLAGFYDPAPKGAGRVRIAIDGEELVNVMTRPAHLNRTDLRLDTRARRNQQATIEVKTSGAALHCFEMGVVD